YWNRGKQLRDIEGKRGAPFGETVMENATEGTIKETTYWRRLEIRFAVSATGTSGTLSRCNVLPAGVTWFGAAVKGLLPNLVTNLVTRWSEWGDLNSR